MKIQRPTRAMGTHHRHRDNHVRGYRALIPFSKPQLPGLLFATWKVLIACQAQNLVVNGSFELPKVTQPASFSDFAARDLWPWQTKEASFELWTNGFYGTRYIPKIPSPTYSADGGQNLELLANAGTNTIWQTVPTVPNELYNLSFYHTPRPNQHSQLTVSITSAQQFVFDENGLTLTAFRWQRFSTTFHAMSNFTTLAFTDVAIPGGSGTSTGAGTHLDGVVLQHIPRLVVQSSTVSALSGSWLGVSNETYQLQYLTALTSTNWVDLGPSLTGNNTTHFFTDAITNAPAKFYRLRVAP